MPLQPLLRQAVDDSVRNRYGWRYPWSCHPLLRFLEPSLKLRVGSSIAYGIEGGTIMFVMREHWLPSIGSRNLIKKYSSDLVSKHHETIYLANHGARLGFDIDYAQLFFKDHDQVLEIGGYPYFLTLPLAERYSITTLGKITSKDKFLSEYGIVTLDCNLDVDKIPADDAKFDGVIMNEVFEHLRIDLIFTMQEIFRVLRPGGTLLLSTPNLRSVTGFYNFMVRGQAYSLLGGIYENYSYLHKEKGNMGHVREYTPIEIIDFLKKIGFAVDGIIYRGCYSGSRALTVAHYITRIWPQLKPFFSVVARKPLQQAE